VAAQQPPTTECNAVPKKTVQKRTEKKLYFNTGTERASKLSEANLNITPSSSLAFSSLNDEGSLFER